MYVQYRADEWVAEHWARNLGANDPSTLGKRRMRRFRALIQGDDPRWREIRKRVSPGARILDVGCGMGQWVRFLNEQGFEATGLDYSEEMISLLKRSMPDLSWICGPMQNIPLDDESQDAVISWGVVEHDGQGPAAALGECYRVLRPGGYAFLTVPIDTPGFRTAIAIQLGECGSERGAFFQYHFTPEEFSALAIAARFCVEHAEPCNRSCGVAYPRVYRWAMGRGRLINGLTRRLFDAVACRKTGACSQVFLIGKKQ